MLASRTNLVNLKPGSLAGHILKAPICHKSKLPPKKAYRWPYEKYSWGYYNMILDPFTRRKMDENSKVIVVEGNVEAGKRDFARRLANELGMKYMPPVDLEGLYINPYGYDYRALNPLLPERLRICDWEMFHEYPNRHSVIHMQYNLFKLRVNQWMEGLRHLFNTGQGIVFDRCVHTEKVIVDAMHDVGWLPRAYLRGDGMQFYDYKAFYEHIRNATLMKLHKPHLTIYLKTPVDVCLERIKNSDDPLIANSKAHTREFLEAVENNFPDLLSRMDYNGLVMEVDYAERATDDEVRDIVDRIEDLDFQYDYKDTRFSFWNEKETKILWYYTYWRRHFTSRDCHVHFNRTQPWFDIAGMGDCISQPDLQLRKVLYENHVGELGWWYDKNADIKTNGFIRAMIDRRNYLQFLDSALRVNYC